MAEIRLLFNTTSLGLKPSDPFLFDHVSLPATIVVCDLICNAPETPLLLAVRERGCSAGKSLPILVH